MGDCSDRKVHGALGMIQQLLAFSPLIIWLVWAGGIAILAFRALPQQRAYQQQFAWYDRGKAMWQRQADPELERLRRAIWRLYGMGYSGVLGSRSSLPACSGCGPSWPAAYSLTRPYPE